MVSHKRTISKVLVIVALVIVIAAILFATINGNNTENKFDELPSEATWAPLVGGDTETSVINNATFVAKGKLLDFDTELRGDEGSELVFTNNHILISKIYALNEDENSEIAKDFTDGLLIVDVIQTGGDYFDYHTAAFKDAPLLESNTDYLLFLEKTEDGYYLPVGGRLGIAKIINGKIEFLNDEAKSILSTFEGDKTSKIINDLISIDDNIDSNIEINENNTSVEEVVEEE
jgi:hypothetical protein